MARIYKKILTGLLVLEVFCIAHAALKPSINASAIFAASGSYAPQLIRAEDYLDANQQPVQYKKLPSKTSPTATPKVPPKVPAAHKPAHKPTYTPKRHPKAAKRKPASQVSKPAKLSPKPSPLDGLPLSGRFVLHLTPTEDPVLAMYPALLNDSGTMALLVDSLNQTLRLNKDIHLVFQSCGNPKQPGLSYEPKKQTITVCYQWMDKTFDRVESSYQKESRKNSSKQAAPKEQLLSVVSDMTDLLVLALYYQMAEALSDTLELPASLNIPAIKSSQTGKASAMQPLTKPWALVSYLLNTQLSQENYTGWLSVENAIDWNLNQTASLVSPWQTESFAVTDSSPLSSQQKPAPAAPVKPSVYQPIDASVYQSIYGDSGQGSDLKELSATAMKTQSAATTFITEQLKTLKCQIMAVQTRRFNQKVQNASVCQAAYQTLQAAYQPWFKPYLK